MSPVADTSWIDVNEIHVAPRRKSAHPSWSFVALSFSLCFLMSFLGLWVPHGLFLAFFVQITASQLTQKPMNVRTFFVAITFLLLCMDGFSKCSWIEKAWREKHPYPRKDNGPFILSCQATQQKALPNFHFRNTGSKAKLWWHKPFVWYGLGTSMLQCELDICAFSATPFPNDIILIAKHQNISGTSIYIRVSTCLHDNYIQSQ